MQTIAILNEKLDFYGKEIYLLEQLLTALRKEIIELFYGFYKSEKLLSKKRQKEFA